MNFWSIWILCNYYLLCQISRYNNSKMKYYPSKKHLFVSPDEQMFSPFNSTPHCLNFLKLISFEWRQKEKHITTYLLWLILKHLVDWLLLGLISFIMSHVMLKCQPLLQQPRLQVLELAYFSLWLGLEWKFTYLMYTFTCLSQECGCLANKSTLRSMAEP